MPKYTRFLFISNDFELGKKIATDLWERRKSWCVASTDNIYDQEVQSIMKDDNYKFLIITTPDEIITKKVNEFIKFCEKYNTLPVFITKKSDYKTDMVHIMYSNLEEVLEDSLEYIHNDEEDFSILNIDLENDEYTYMLNILSEYLW